MKIWLSRLTKPFSTQVEEATLSQSGLAAIGSCEGISRQYGLIMKMKSQKAAGGVKKPPQQLRGWPLSCDRIGFFRR